MVFAPFLECCGDAVMFAKQNAAHDGVTGIAIVFCADEVAVVAMK